MGETGLLLTLAAGLLLILLPRRMAAAPLLLGAANMTCGQVLEVGPAHFTTIRVLVVLGFMRVMARGEHLANGINGTDRLMILWAAWLIGSSAFHTQDAWVFRSGVVWTELGSYLLLRVFLGNLTDVERVFRVLCVGLFPVALEMLVEKSSGENYFAPLGGVVAFAELRNGHFRAHGTFSHAILAGTAGASCLPMVFCLWRRHRWWAAAGLVSLGAMVYASGSSGPVMMTCTALLGLALFPMRGHLRGILRMVVMAACIVNLFMNAPIYYLIARIDITGGSTGWHRARLIESSIEHFQEWWLVGTDYTRHWMSTGIYANDNHTDITNHFLQMGVWGGLPLLLIFVVILITTFSRLGLALREEGTVPRESRFLIWTLGAILAAQTVNFISITLFDQSIIFFYLILAGASAVQCGRSVSAIPVQASGAGSARCHQSVGGLRNRTYSTAPAAALTAKAVAGIVIPPEAELTRRAVEHR